MGSVAASHPNLVLLGKPPQDVMQGNRRHPDSFFDPRASNKTRSERQQPKFIHASLILGSKCGQVNRNAWEICTAIVIPPVCALRN